MLIGVDQELWVILLVQGLIIKWMELSWNIQWITLDNQADFGGVAAVSIGRLTNIDSAIIRFNSTYVEIQILTLARRAGRRHGQLETIHLIHQLIESPPVDGQRWIARGFATQDSLRSRWQNCPTGVDPDFGCSWFLIRVIILLILFDG